MELKTNELQAFWEDIDTGNRHEIRAAVCVSGLAYF